MFWKKTKPKAIENQSDAGFDSPNKQQTFRWGRLDLPNSEGPNHIAAIGTTGSGKTSLIRLLQQSVLPNVGKGDCRALVYDAKQDALPILSSIVDPSLIVTLNPFDDRGAAWDLAKDLDEPRIMMEFAATIIAPAPNESQPFFTDGARHLLYGVLLSYYLSKFDYKFADVLRPLRDLDLLKSVIGRHRQTNHIGNCYFHDQRMAANLMSTIQSKILFFEPIAACWERATRLVSIKDWAKSEYILVLGNSEVSRSAIDTINRCIFKRASDVTLDLGESTSRRTWVFLDEAADAGRLQGLVSLAKKGRSKGACVVLAFQSISGLRDPQLYGQFGTDELLGQIGTRFIGRLECPVTAQYVSELIGDQDITTISTSYTSGKNSSTTTNYQRQVKKAVLPSQLLDLPPCNLENGLTGFCIVRSVGTFKTHMDGQDLFEGQLIPPDPNVPAFILRDPMSQILEPWTPEQALAFGINLSEPLPPKPRKRRKKKPMDAVVAENAPIDPLKDLFE